MSGAEVLAAVGLASNILQFVEFTTHLCQRVQEYSSATSGLPKELAQQAAQLAELLHLLEELSHQPEALQVGNGVLEQCQSQAHELAGILEDLQGGAGKSRWGNAKVAFKSLKRTQQIDKLQLTLERLIQLLGLQLQVQAKRTADHTGNDVSTLLSLQTGQLSLLESLQDNSAAGKLATSTVDGSKPVWIVPLSRNPRFVGREEALEALEDELTKKDENMAIAALYGLGGVGKTQVVLEHVFRTRDPTIAVFWVYASSPSRFLESYKRIASECKIPGHDDPNSDILQLVRDWLESQRLWKWLMIIDNVDDRTAFFNRVQDISADRALIEYVPQAAKCTLIYTTRSRDIGIDLLAGAEPIEVSPMSTDEALTLLGERITRGGSREDQIVLLEELAYLPLAISQATAFMIKRRKTVTEYVKLLRDESTKKRVLDHRTLHHGREDRSSESVTSTWWITFQSMKEESPRSAELLTMMCLLDRQQIPLALLQDLEEDSFDFEEAIAILEAYSLITTYIYFDDEREQASILYQLRPALSDPIPKFCDLHRLVQSSTREWLDQPKNDRLSILIETLALVSEAFPCGFYETWPVCQLLYSHANSLLQRSFASLVDPAEVGNQDYARIMRYCSSLLHKLSTYSRQQGDLYLSLDRAKESLEIRRHIFQPGSEEILESLESFALTTDVLGSGIEARGMLRDVLEGRDKLLGPNHRKTLESLNQLGSSLRSLGEYAEAEVIHRRELSGKRMLHDLEPENPDIVDDLVIALNNVANVLRDQGEHWEAQKLLEEAFQRSQAMNGQSHPQIWLIMESLAINSGQLAQYDKAHDLFAQVIAGRAEVFGRTHYSTLITRGQLVSLLSEEGRYPESEKEGKLLLHDEALIYGVAKYSTMHNLGLCLHQQRKYSEAESVFKDLLELQLKNPHLDVNASSRQRNNMPTTDASTSRDLVRICLEAQGKLEEAKLFEDSSLSSPIAEIDLKEAKDLYEKSRDLYWEGGYEQSEKLARQGLEILKKQKDPDNDQMHNCLFQIALSMHEQNHSSDTQTLTRQVLAYRKRSYGWRSTKTHDALRFLAATLRDRGNFEEAEGHYRQLVLWVSNTFGRLDVKNYDARWRLANVLSTQRKYVEAEEVYRQNLEIQLQHPIESKPEETAQAYHNLACVLWYQGKYEEGEDYFQQAYDRRLALFGESDTRTIKTLGCLADILAEQGKFGRADQLYSLIGDNVQLPLSDHDDLGPEDSVDEDR